MIGEFKDEYIRKTMAWFLCELKACVYLQILQLNANNKHS